MAADAAALDDVDLRQRVLRYCLQSASSDVASKQQSAVLAALLGLLPNEWQRRPDQQPQQRLWCTDSSVADADVQLQLLLRGEEDMPVTLPCAEAGAPRACLVPGQVSLLILQSSCASGEDLAREQLSGDTAAISDLTQQHVPPAAQERLLQAAQLELDKLVRSRFPQQAAAEDDVQSAGFEIAPLVLACSTFAACAAVVSAAGAGKAAAGRPGSSSVLASGEQDTGHVKCARSVQM